MRAGWRIALGSVLLLQLGVSGAARAQVPATQEQQRPAQGLREAERAGRAAREGAALRPLTAGDRVTYEDVLKNPDNVELNYLYAQSQVAAGELRGAASTLERILLVAPDLARVRLLYAVVLFRLDNLNESEREFRAVSKLPMPENLRVEVDRYLDEIALRRKVTRVTGNVGLGMQWDSNRNAGPDGNQVLFFDTPFSLVTGQKQGDFSGIMLAGARVSHDLGYDAGHQLLGAAQLFGQKQIDQTDLDLGAASGEAGGLIRAPYFDILPSLYGSYLNLAGESYVSSAGTGVRANHRFSQTLEAYGRFRFDYEFFNSLERSPITDQRTGPRYQGGIGASYSPLPILRLEAAVGAVNKVADEDFYTYTGPQLYLGGTWLLGQGQFLLGTFTYEYDDYDGPEQVVSQFTRRDSIYLGRVTYGAPLGFLLSYLSPPRAISDTVLSANIEYLSEMSTIPNYSYDNMRISLMFTKTFDF